MMALVDSRTRSDVSVFVLAGGKSSRMGGDKALLEFDRRPLLTRMLELGNEISDDVRIVGGRERFSAFGPVVEDLYLERGPLGGIHAALGATDRELSLVLAVDLPFLTADFLAWLVGQAR